ncbi:hypothetical protein CMI47_10530 [Candidatus Pacearchaeota archaeon]|nr:hypothetical protein [Candidatus Pacearchaeota archaeon]|tara:strand:+ start:299 stop:655 length:357 start_codon:yes stop_codon:yes gene_type:complete
MPLSTDIPIPVSVIFGAVLRAIRQEKGLTQTEVGGFLHSGQSGYAKMETGVVVTHFLHMESFCEKLDVEIDEIYRRYEAFKSGCVERGYELSYERVTAEQRKQLPISILTLLLDEKQV